MAQLKCLKWMILTLLFMALPAHAATLVEGEIAPVETLPIEQVIPEIHLMGLAGQEGKNLTAFYVSGREATLSLTGQVLKVRSLKHPPVTVRVSSRGDVQIPETRVESRGWDAFNYILFVAHNQPEVYLRNQEGRGEYSYPRDPRVANERAYRRLNETDFAYTGMWFISLPKLQTLIALQARSGRVSLDVQRDRLMIESE